MKNSTMRLVCGVVAACFLTGCGSGGGYVKSGKKFKMPGGDRYTGEDYIQELAGASAASIDIKLEEKAKGKDKGGIVASDPDMALIANCMENAKLKVEQQIIQKVIEGRMNYFRKINGRDMLLTEAKLEAEAALPHISSYEIYHIVSDDCYSNSGKDKTAQIEQQSKCGCEYFGAIEKSQIEDGLKGKYDKETVEAVKRHLFGK